MKSTQRLVFFILLFMLVACDKEIFKSRGIGFPLRQSWVFKTEGNVTAVSGLGNWIAVGTTEDLNAIDANNEHTIW